MSFNQKRWRRTNVPAAVTEKSIWAVSCGHMLFFSHPFVHACQHKMCLIQHPSQRHCFLGVSLAFFFCLPCGQAVRYSWCHFPNGLCGKCLLHFCQEGGVCLCAVWRLVSMLPWLSLKFVQDVLLSICGSGPDRLCESKSSGRGCNKNTAITVTGLVRQEFRIEIIPAWMVSIKKTCQSEGYVRLIFHKRWQLTSTSNKNGQSQTESDRFFVVLSGQAQTAIEILQFIHPWYYDRQLCRVMALTRENR